MENFFAEFTSPESTFLLIVALGSFLIGFLTAWLLWGGEAKRFRKEAEQWKKNHDELLAQYKTLKEESDARLADLTKAQRDADQASVLAQSLQADKSKWQHDLDLAIEDSVKARASAASYQITLEDLNSQLVGLKTMNNDLADTVGQLELDKSNLESELARLNSANQQIVTLQTEFSSLQAAHSDAIQRLSELHTEIAHLRAGTTIANSAIALETPTTNEIFAAPPERTVVEKGESLTLSAVAARDKVAAVLGTKIPYANENNKDDLTRIKGIGTFLEKKLNALGIYTYEQISRFDAETIEDVTTAIEFFPGRIERDDWPGQAAALLGQTPSIPLTTAADAKKMSDLKTVEGIGPKIEKLLKDNGIADLPALSVAHEKRLREILFVAGSKYRIHDPTTWPEQAALAVKGEWDTLKVLQDRLKGGRETTE